MDTKMRSPFVLSAGASRERLMTADSALRDSERLDAIGRHSESVDYAQAVHERTTGLALRLVMNETRDEICRALDRLSVGLYGICEVCSAPISADRLSVLPEATRCLECQRGRERDLGRCA